MTTDGPYGFLKPSVDAHVLGITSIGDMLTDLGKEVVFAPPEVCHACDRPEGEREAAAVESWIRDRRIASLGFSYRLSPDDGVDLFARLVRQLERRSLFSDQGGPIRALYFAGLPLACRLARERVRRLAAVFDGEETPQETLHRLGVRPSAFARDTDRAINLPILEVVLGPGRVPHGSVQRIDGGPYAHVSRLLQRRSLSSVRQRDQRSFLVLRAFPASSSSGVYF